MLIKENDFYVRESSIHGKGLFCRRSIRKGEMLSVPDFNGVNIIEESELCSLFETNKAARDTGWRICNNMFAYVDDEFGSYPEDFVNHSRKNNCIYHCCYLFAIEDIPKDTELTVNYEHILPGGHVLQLGSDTVIGEDSVKVIRTTAEILAKSFMRV